VGINVDPLDARIPQLNQQLRPPTFQAKLQVSLLLVYSMHSTHQSLLAASTMSGKKRPGPAASKVAVPQVCHCLSSVVGDSLMGEKKGQSQANPDPRSCPCQKNPSGGAQGHRTFSQGRQGPQEDNIDRLRIELCYMRRCIRMGFQSCK
jgi:hypothetical protein